MKIVLTGGPSAGKTTIAEVIARTHAKTFCLVPESASILFRGGFPRAREGESLCYQQVAIYHVQRQLENTIAATNPDRHLVCDRGTLDGLAYWPGDPSHFFMNVQSSLDKELARYDWVIELHTANPVFYGMNSLRIETAEEAQVLNDRIKDAWSQHPNYIVVNNSLSFENKMDRVLKVIAMILSGENAVNIRRELETRTA